MGLGLLPVTQWEYPSRRIATHNHKLTNIFGFRGDDVSEIGKFKSISPALTLIYEKYVQ